MEIHIMYKKTKGTDIINTTPPLKKNQFISRKAECVCKKLQGSPFALWLMIKPL